MGKMIGSLPCCEFTIKVDYSGGIFNLLLVIYLMTFICVLFLYIFLYIKKHMELYCSNNLRFMVKLIRLYCYYFDPLLLNSRHIGLNNILRILCFLLLIV